MTRCTGVLAIGLWTSSLQGQTPPGSGSQSARGELEPASFARADSSALVIVRRAIASLGGPYVLIRANGLEVTGHGTYDLGARLQGRRPDAPEPVSLEERIALRVDSAGVVALAIESRTHINPDAEEWMRTLFHHGERPLIIDRLARRAFRVGTSGSAEDRQRVARAVPHVLLAEAAASDELRFIGRELVAGDTVDLVRFPLPSGHTLTLRFEARRGLLTGFEYPLAMPVRGATTVQWAYDAYRQVDGVGPYPGGHTVSIDERMVRRVTYTGVRQGGAASELFTLPPDVVVPPPPPETPRATDSSTTPSPGRPASDVRTLAPGVYLAPNVRPGFHHLFAEFADFVLVVDATAPWRELHEIPASNDTSGSAVGVLGERLIEIVRSRIPNKPIRYVALTHHHDDHAGGVKPFVDAGATVLATATTRRVVERVASGARVELVEGSRVIADSTMEVRLIDVGANPHSDGMLVAWLPRQRILYTADLWEPAPERFFPSVARTPVMRWFVDWLDTTSGLDPDQIFAIHGSARVTPEQIAAIRALSVPRRRVPNEQH